MYRVGDQKLTNFPDWTRLWVSTCFFRLLAWVNAFWQREHLYGRSPVWTRVWLFNPEDRAKGLWQMVQWYFFSSMCTRVWLLRSLRVAKDWPQYPHWCGFLKVCRLLMWSCKSLSIEKRYWHPSYVHSIGFTSWKCINFNLLIILLFAMTTKQHHLRINLPAWKLRWVYKKYFAELQSFSQTAHLTVFFCIATELSLICSE